MFKTCGLVEHRAKPDIKVVTPHAGSLDLTNVNESCPTSYSSAQLRPVYLSKTFKGHPFPSDILLTLLTIIPLHLHRFQDA